MQAIVFADLTNRRLSTTLGGNALSFPAFVQGDKARIGMRFVERVEGSALEVTRTVTSLRASIGYIDARPTSGNFVLRVGAGPYTQGVNQTVAIAHNASAATVQAVLVAIGLSNASVSSANGSWVISNAGAEVALTGVPAAGIANELTPMSFVRVRSSVRDSLHRYEVRLVQAPLASTASFENIVPPAPGVSLIQQGGSSETTEWPEIQALKILPTFRGTYQIRRGYKKSGELSVDDGPEEIQAAIASLADEGGLFTVTNPATNIAHITFGGSMSGIPQDLLEIQVFSAPPGDATFTLDLNTAEVAAALAAADEIKPFLEIEVTVEDENDPEKTYVLTPFRAPITLVRELNWAGLETAANIDWLRPPHGRTYVPFTEDQIITGAQNYVTPVGDGTNSDFIISHNLGTRDLHITVRENGGDCTVIAPESITLDSEDDLTITFQTAPLEDEFVVTISTAGPESAFQEHTHTIEQVEGLQLILDDLGSRIEDLEDLLPSFAASAANANASIVSEWELADIFEIYPTRSKIAATDVSSIAPADIPRAGGLLPAAYTDDDPTEVTELPESPDTETIWKNGGTDTIALPGYLGRKSSLVPEDGCFAYDGRGFYQVEKVIDDDDVYYPTDFVRELFRIPVNAKQLRLGKSFTLDFSLVAAVLKANVSAQWGVIIDIGLPTKEGTASANLFDVEFLAPSLDHSFLVTPIPSSHNFGLRITRKLEDSVDTIKVDSMLYGSLEATATGADMTSANFVVRGRLHRFDTQDNKTDPRGLIAFNGLSATLGEESDPGFGKATIK